jgi:hypothetical protein
VPHVKTKLETKGVQPQKIPVTKCNMQFVVDNQNAYTPGKAPHPPVYNLFKSAPVLRWNSWGGVVVLLLFLLLFTRLWLQPKTAIGCCDAASASSGGIEVGIEAASKRRCNFVRFAMPCQTMPCMPFLHVVWLAVSCKIRTGVNRCNIHIPDNKFQHR